MSEGILWEFTKKDLCRSYKRNYRRDVREVIAKVTSKKIPGQTHEGIFWGNS